MRGEDAATAGNLCAYLEGIAPARTSWTPEQIARCLFLRELWDQGRIGGPGITETIE